MKKRNILMVISILLLAIPFFINFYSKIRLLIYIIGLILFSSILFKYKKNIIVNVMIIFTVLFSTYFVDYYLCNLKRYPIFSHKVVSSPKVKTFYSLFYKIDVCDGKWSNDRFYSKGYACNKNDLKEISVNDFLSVYESNKGAYLKIKGKVSKIVGDSLLELQPYEVATNSRNGNVDFKKDIVLSIPISEKEKKVYKIYDEILIIGKVDKVSKKNEVNQYLFTDTKIFASDIYDNYDISLEKDNNCNLDKTLLGEDENYKYFKSCLNAITVKYNDENIYDLDYVLLDKRITMDELLNKSDLIKEENDNKLYNLNNLEIIKCNNNDVIFGSNFKDVNDYCIILEEDEGV